MTAVLNLLCYFSFRRKKYSAHIANIKDRWREIAIEREKTKKKGEMMREGKKGER